MKDAYRSPAAAAEVRGWCTQTLAGWPVPHAVETIGTSLGETTLVRLGSGAPRCVYLPGTNFNAATSLPVLAALGQLGSVVCADLPGQPGLSAATRPRDELAGYAGWVAEVLTAARADATGPVVLVGHSRGAAVALSADPGTVDALVLACPAGLARVRVTPGVLAATVPWLVRPTAERSARLAGLLAGRPGLAGGGTTTAWLELVARCTRTTGAPGPLPAQLLRRWRDRPVTVLAGEHDVFFPPERLAGVCRDVWGVALSVVPETGHLLVDQAPGAVADAVRRLVGTG